MLLSAETFGRCLGSYNELTIHRLIFVSLLSSCSTVWRKLHKSSEGRSHWTDLNKEPSPVTSCLGSHYFNNELRDAACRTSVKSQCSPKSTNFQNLRHNWVSIQMAWAQVLLLLLAESVRTAVTSPSAWVASRPGKSHATAFSSFPQVCFSVLLPLSCW
jgi:hypothetical protein